MNTLMQFEGNKVDIIQDENDNLLFELYSTGMALGYIKYAKDKPYPQKDRIDKTLTNAEITAVVHGVQLFLTESQLYDFMLEARTDKCRKFRKWVTNEVLPSIRKTGSYSAFNTPATSSAHQYKYIDKTYCGQPILTVADICYFFEISASSIYQFICMKRLVNDVDYVLLKDLLLKKYLEENPSVARCRKSVYVFFKSGFDKLVNYFGLSVENAPAIMTETISNQKGFAVGNCVVDVMSYIRKELKGIEALTYLLESNDSQENLENYRHILINRLSAINWWKVDVQTVKLGIHSIKMNERKAITAGERGLRY